jgi:hypothetical protein
MLAATIARAPAFTVTARATLFTGDYLSNSSQANYDVTPDGTRFLMLRPASDEPPELVVAPRWLAEQHAQTTDR